MVGALVAAAALALGSHSPPTQRRASTRSSQLTPAATCVETVPLLEAGATTVAPSLRVFRLPLATARRLAAGLRARGALADDRARPSARRRRPCDDVQPDPLEPDGVVALRDRHRRAHAARAGKPVTVVDSGIDLQHPEFLGRPDTVALNPQEPAPLGGEHGTGVASLVGAPRNGVGIVGVYPQAVLRSWDTALGQGTSIDACRGGPRHHRRRRRRPRRDQPQPRQHGPGPPDRAGDRRGVRKRLTRRRRGRERRRPAATRPTIRPTTRMS